MVTSLMRWNPFGEVRRLQEEMNRLLNASFDTEGTDLGPASWNPAVDIEETADSLRVSAELPGVKQEDIHVEFENGLLSIHGERKREEETKGRSYHRLERSFGSFTRTFRLPASVDSEKISARFEDGVLKLEMPKREGAKARKIEVGAGQKQIK